VSDRRKEGKGVRDDALNMGPAFSAGSSSGSDVDRGVKPTNAELQSAGGARIAHENGRSMDGLQDCMNSENKGNEEVPQFVDIDEKWRECLLINPDEEVITEVMKIEYLTEEYKTHHKH
jgi:hypothetical protein